MSDEPSKTIAGPDYERSEAGTRFIALFGVAMMLLLIALVLALQMYVDHVREEQIFVKTLQPVSEDLLALRAREAGELHSYAYIDRAKGTVRIPIERAMELVVKERGHE